jgi:hypothetical protein
LCLGQIGKTVVVEVIGDRDDAADMASLDDEVSVRIDGNAAAASRGGPRRPSSIRAGKRASFRLKCTQVNASPKLREADSASP